MKDTLPLTARDVRHCLRHTRHPILYLKFMLSACTLFSKTWIEVPGSGPCDLAKQLKNQQMVSRLLHLWLGRWHPHDVTIGHGRSPRRIDVQGTQERYSHSCRLQRAIIRLLSVATDLLGAIRSGTWILMAIATIYSCALFPSRPTLPF
jgi:protein transport protein SEC61 subunit alpha